MEDKPFFAFLSINSYATSVDMGGHGLRAFVDSINNTFDTATTILVAVQFLQ
jgi:hypothetical protein